MQKRCLLLDWGGTIMVSMPVYLGGGKGWTQEAAVPGVVETITAITSAYPDLLVGLASNASESDETEIITCLDSIGMGEIMDAVYTIRQTGKPKPWPEFWAYALRDLRMQPEQVVMVGDDYMADVWGPVQVGMRAVWLNRRTQENKQGLLYTTIHDFSELSAALQGIGFL